MITINQIREKFLNFFKSKGSTIVASDSLVPKNDPTVLFTTAGMQQFKRQFLGNIDEYSKAATSQKCLRTDDLDEVGKTDFHHTFFEMLGNFSFGDYFKKEAISWAWEFLTKEMGISPDKLWVSVYKDDSEAYDIWMNDIKISKNRIVKLGDKSNFWPSDAKKNGPNGPCGPCSEIFFDYGENANCTSKKCDPDCDCGRFSEIWNLVFTQFNRKDGGELEPLPNKNIDTGMGLERLASVVQGKRNNFDTDVFEPILTAIEKKITKGALEIPLKEKRIIADHIRAIVFGINDGVIPSNKERGSVMKRLITDSTNIVLNCGVNEPTIYKLVPSVIKAMGKPYPELKKKEKDIKELIKGAEEAFILVRNQRIPELEKKIKECGPFEKIVDIAETAKKLGELIFIYRDTYGLPLMTIKEIVEDQLPKNKRNIVNDAIEIYENKMKKQQEQSRASSKMAGDVFVDANLNLDVPKTQFDGHQQQATKNKILALIMNGEQVNSVKKSDKVCIVLDKTPFYAESGGQIADTGYIKTDKAKIIITNTTKMDDIFIHEGVVEEGTIKVNDTVSAEIDVERRLSIMRNHTATHLLQTALREVLGTHVQQQGSFVAEDRLRFDFTHPKALTKDQISQIEDVVNTYVRKCSEVKKVEMTIEEAKKSGALAFFQEKYGNTVRIVSIEEYSKEFCGGTHLDYTGQIGLFKILGESAIAQGIRRIEATTGRFAYEYTKDLEKKLETIASAMKAPVSEVVERVNIQTKKLKVLEKELDKLQLDKIKGNIDNLIKSSNSIGKVKIITHLFKNVDIKVLRQVSDLIKQKEKSCVSVLASEYEGDAYILISVTDDLIKKDIKANTIIQEVAPIIEGSGGGRPQLAQAGSKNCSKLSKAIEKAKDLITKQLNAI